MTRQGWPSHALAAVASLGAGRGGPHGKRHNCRSDDKGEEDQAQHKATSKSAKRGALSYRCSEPGPAAMKPRSRATGSLRQRQIQAGNQSCSTSRSAYWCASGFIGILDPDNSARMNRLGMARRWQGSSPLVFGYRDRLGNVRDYRGNRASVALASGPAVVRAS
jgi:hypothetical protein